MTRQSFLFYRGLWAGSTTASCQTLLRLSARPCLARKACFSRLICPLMAVLLEVLTFFLFFCFLLTKNYLETAESSPVGCVTPFQSPERTHSSAGQRKRPPGKQIKTRADDSQLQWQNLRCGGPCPNLVGLYDLH